MDIIIPVELSSHRRMFESDISNAQTRIRRFAEDNGWAKFCGSFIDRAEIFGTKKSFDAAVSCAINTSPAVFPKSFCACLEGGIFRAVSPELYKENYPEGIENAAYEKLIAHEIAHRLHVSVLKGAEEKMGPIWFFEGFAIVAADQFAGTMPKLTMQMMLDIIRDDNRGSYKQYAAVMKHALAKVELSKMVVKAGGDDFLEWLQTECFS